MRTKEDANAQSSSGIVSDRRRGHLSAGPNRRRAASSIDKASAYYHYALAHMYAELAGRRVRQPPGNSDYVNKAIENYKEAIKADPKTPLLSEELSELYIGSGRLARSPERRRGRAQAESQRSERAPAAGAHLHAADRRRQQNRIDEAMLHKAIEQYREDHASSTRRTSIRWLMLGRLQKVAQNSVEAQNAYKKVLELDPDNEDALTGLAMVYATTWATTHGAADLLKKLADKNPSPRSLRALAAAYEQMREFGLAADALKRVLETNPPDAGDVKRGMAQDQLSGEAVRPGARRHMQELVTEEPNDAQSYLAMSQIYRPDARFREGARGCRTRPQPSSRTISRSATTRWDSSKPRARCRRRSQLLKDILASTAKRNYNPDRERGSR